MTAAAKVVAAAAASAAALHKFSIFLQEKKKEKNRGEEGCSNAYIFLYFPCIWSGLDARVSKMYESLNEAKTRFFMLIGNVTTSRNSKERHHFFVPPPSSRYQSPLPYHICFFL